MKIMLQNEIYLPKVGGIQTTIEELANTFALEGHEVTIFTWQFDKKLNYEEKISEKITVKRYSLNRNKFNLFYPAKHLLFLKKVLRREMKNYDLIISRHPVMCCAAMLSKNKKNKLVYIPAALITSLMTKPKIKYGIKENVKIIASMIKYYQEGIMQKKVLKNLEKVVVFSKEMMRQIEESVNRKEEIILIRPGIKKSINKIEKSKAREKLGIPKEKLMFIFVGRIAKIKNVSMLVNSFSKISNKDSILGIVGDGEDLEVKLLKDNIEKNKLNDRVILFGRQNELSYYYSAADYMVLPSNYESFGLVIVEAMKCGTPVVGFKKKLPNVKTAIEEIVTNNYSGFVIEEFSEDALTEKMDYISEIYLNQKEKYDLISKNALKDVEEYNWKKFVEKLEME